MRRNAMVFLFLLTSCCQGLESLPQEPKDFEVIINEDPDANRVVMSNDVLQRAYQMATIEWTPLKRIPYRNGIYYEPGKRVTGVPYSSVKEINTYLFQNVSYYTFMTAVHNPYSVLYTEDISQEPYHGTNCTPYYGAVCSSSVMFALGFSIPYYTSQIKDLPWMRKIEPQLIDSLKVCDVIWKEGHVQMVIDTEFKADTLYRVTTFESSGMSAHINKYSKEQFKSMWDKEAYAGYRYKNIEYSIDSPIFQALEPIVYNDDLCPSKGDRSVYRTDDEIVINIFNSRYKEIVLEKDNTVIASAVYKGEEYIFQDLTPGIYHVYLQNGNEKTASVSFEIINVEVSYTRTDDGRLFIYFSPADQAEYAALCTLQGDSVYYPISDNNREQGYIVTPARNSEDYYCKVVFKGRFGTIINKPIKVI